MRTAHHPAWRGTGVRVRRLADVQFETGKNYRWSLGMFEGTRNDQHENKQVSDWMSLSLGTPPTPAPVSTSCPAFAFKSGSVSYAHCQSLAAGFQVLWTMGMERAAPALRRPVPNGARSGSSTIDFAARAPASSGQYVALGFAGTLLQRACPPR